MQKGARTDQGQVIVQDHIPKVKDFFHKECFKGHPKPYADFMEWRKKEDELQEHNRQKLIPGL